MSVTDYKFAGTAATVDRSGGPAWSNQDYAKADDTSYATCFVSGFANSDWLRLTNFGFTSSDIPSGATIDGIEFVISRTATFITDLAIYMRDSTGQVGSDQASATGWPTSIGEATYGASDEMLGTTLDQADIVASTFGIDISAHNSFYLFSTTAYVDYIKIRIYYTAATVPTVTTQALTNVKNTNATGNGNITDIGVGNATRRGFCYKAGTSGDPTTGDSVAYDDGSYGTGAYTKGLTGLSAGTGYRVRAYAVNPGGTSYGVSVQLTTTSAASGFVPRITWI